MSLICFLFPIFFLFLFSYLFLKVLTAKTVFKKVFLWLTGAIISLFSELFKEFSGVILWVCKTIWRLLGVILRGFPREKTIQRVKEQTRKTICFTI